MPVVFKEVSAEKAIKMAKKEVNKMTGAGIFSSWYWLGIFEGIAERILQQGVPVITDHNGKVIT